MAAVAKHREQAAKPSAASSQASLTAEARAAAERAVVSATITEHNRQHAATSSKDMAEEAADIQGKRDAEMATEFSETGGLDAVMAAVEKHRHQARDLARAWLWRQLAAGPGSSITSGTVDAHVTAELFAVVKAAIIKHRQSSVPRLRTLAMQRSALALQQR